MIMSGSHFGKNFTITTWGESHGPAMGTVIDGCPAGISLSAEDIQQDINRRRPGLTPYTSQRKEPDSAIILSGVFNNVTTGTPISIIINNVDKRSDVYSEIAKVYRPGHADYTYDIKYGMRDYRGGGRASARETVCRVAGGAVARRFLSEIDVSIQAYTLSVGKTYVDMNRFDLAQTRQNPFCMPDRLAYEQAVAEANTAIKDGNSLGGVIECVIKGVSGIGEPVFDKLSALLAQAIFSINAVKGFEIGAGFKAAEMKGTENNDAMYYEDGKLKKSTNHAGGIYGGIADGSDIVFRAAFKPTPSISILQNTINAEKENTKLSLKGRHDPLIVPRAVVVVEAMAALVIADLTLQNCMSNIKNIKKLIGDLY
jgi:chorismate synthase